MTIRAGSLFNRFKSGAPTGWVAKLFAGEAPTERKLVMQRFTDGSEFGGHWHQLLFFVDHNVTSLLTQASENHLRKGNAYHWNFLLVGLFNIFMPMFGCPFVTGSLPHSPQFVQALAIREQVATPSGSTTTRIVYVYENRIAPLITNVLIMVSLFVTPVFAYLPKIPSILLATYLIDKLGRRACAAACP